MKHGWRSGTALVALGLALTGPALTGRALAADIPASSPSAVAPAPATARTPTPEIAPAPAPVAVVSVPVAIVPASRGGPLTPEDIMGLSDMRQVALSPDGRTALFMVQDQMSTFTPQSEVVWSVATDGKSPARRFAFAKGYSHGAKFSHDGKWVAFLSNRENPLAAPGAGASGLTFRTEPRLDAAPVEANATQVWRMAPDGGEAVPLTAMAGGVDAFAWSPDGRAIAFIATDPAPATERADREAKKDAVQVDRYKHFARVWVLDIASGLARRVSPDGLNASDVTWSPDGRTLAVNVAPTPAIDDAFYHTRIVLLAVDAAARTTVSRLRDPGMISAASEGDWSKDGRAIVYEEIRKDGAPEPLRGGISVALRVFDVASGKITHIGDDYPGLLTQARWTSRGDIVALSFEKTRSRLVRIDPASGRITPFADFDGELSAFALSTDGRTIVAAGDTPDRPADVYTVKDGRFTPITRINPQVAQWKLGKVEQVSWKSTIDGRTVYGVLVTPPGYVPGTPIRTVTQIHGGPEWAWWSGWLGSWHEWAQMLATHGYAVFLPNMRGSDGQDVSFTRAVRGDWGGADFQDINDGLDMLVARGIADPQRLGIGGWSYGGFMSGWAVTHSTRFKTAILGAAVTDLAAMALTTDTPSFPWDYYGDVPSHQAAYDNASSVRFLDKVKVPVLVLHGQADPRVPIQQGRHFYRGLRMLGKPAEMVEYPREPHWFGEREHQLDVEHRVLDWFDRHL